MTEIFISSYILIPIMIILSFLTISFSIIFIIKKTYIKVPPNKAAILYGKRFKIRDETTRDKIVVGFRIIKGGATFKIPFI